jgi:integrase
VSVYKQPGSPYYLVEFEYQGKRYRKSSETTSKTKAQEIERTWRLQLKDQFHLGKLPDHTWGEAVKKYLETVITPKSKPGTADTHWFVLKAIGEALGNDTKLVDITAAKIAQYKDQMTTAGRSPATVNKHLSFIKAILYRCVDDWHWLAKVPAIKLEKLKNGSLVYLTKEEEGRLLPHLEEDLKALVIFLIDTGARLSEATTLTWANVDLDRKPKAVVQFVQTKNDEARGVPLTNRCADLLKRLKTENKGRPIVTEDTALVFLKSPPSNEQQGSKSYGKWRRWDQPFRLWKAALKKAKLPETFRIHDLRHTFASRLVIAQVPILNVSKLLGHKSIKMTMRYAHLAPDSLATDISVLD